MVDKQTIELEHECSYCKGTGLYKGMAERDNCAVVCYKCEGTGKYLYKYSYIPFTGRKKRTDIKRVFFRSCGFVHSDLDYIDRNGKNIPFSKTGCTYEEWLEGKPPEPVRELYCPYLWTNQELQRNDVNDLYKNRCRKLLCGSITNCLYYKNKKECWEIYDRGCEMK